MQTHPDSVLALARRIVEPLHEPLLVLDEELQRRRRELRRSAHGARDDLREPLRMVTSCRELLERRYGDRQSGGTVHLEAAEEGATFPFRLALEPQETA